MAKATTRDKLALGETYITAQSQAAPALGAKVAPQAAAVQSTHDVLQQKIADRKELSDLILIKDTEIMDATRSYDTALQEYALGAVKAADGDVVALQNLGAAPIPTRRKKITGPPAAPDNVRLSSGPVAGSLTVKHGKPAGAGSFAVEYKLEPSQPADPWLAPEALQSRTTSHQLDGLAPGQLVRVRVRALGDGWGPYSAEVLGVAGY